MATLLHIATFHQGHSMSHLTRSIVALIAVSAIAVFVVETGYQSLAHARAVPTATLGPNKDNTLYEDANGSLSNGSGEFMFGGRTGNQEGGTRMRPLVAFDLSSIPAG